MKASYTVEAAVIFSVCTIFIGSMILLGYEVYHGASEQVTAAEEDFSAVDSFRKHETIRAYAGRLRENIGKAAAGEE